MLECPKVHVALVSLGFNGQLMNLSEQEALDTLVSQMAATGTVKLMRHRAGNPILKSKIDSQVKPADADVEGYLAKS
jgi:hypothetical protein